MSESGFRTRRATLVAGFAFFLVALVVATRNPATGYELSIYHATPTAFWVGIGVAFVAATATLLSNPSDRLSRIASFLLVYLTTMAVVMLPVLRGYAFYGVGDALTHLGWIRELGTGVLSPANLFYPGAHSITVFLHGMTGLEYPLAATITVFAFLSVYLLALPLCVRVLTDYPGALVVGLFVAVLWLPINGLSVHRLFHPISLGIMFAPFVLYLALQYVSLPVTNRKPTGIGALMALSLLAMVLVHPQAALIVIVVFASVSLLQFVLRRTKNDHPIARHRTLYAQTGFASIVFLYWTVRFDRAVSTFERRVETVQTLLQGGTVGGTIPQRGRSLAELGSSLPELFVKLFLPSVVLLAVVALFLVLRWRTAGPWLEGDDDRLLYLVAGIGSLGVVFALTFLARTSTLYFRYLGAVMVLVGIVGAVALSSFARRLARSKGSRAGLTVVVVLLVLLAPISAITLYPSPFVYLSTPHVTQAEAAGYETTVDHRAEGVQFTGVRDNYHRFVDGTVGTERSKRSPPQTEHGVRSTVFDTNLSTHYDRSTYLLVTQRDYEREVGLYDGFRYSRKGFRSLDTTPGIHRVQSNGQYNQYLLSGTPGTDNSTAR